MSFSVVGKEMNKKCKECGKEFSGHFNKKYCDECKKIKIKEQSEKIRAKPGYKRSIKEYGKGYRQRPEVKAKRKQQKKEYYQNNKESIKNLL